MKKYEISALVSSQLSEEEIKAFSEKLTSMITTGGGENVLAKSPIRKRLGYAIKHERQAWFLVITFEMDPEKLEVLNNQAKDLTEILRFMVVNQTPIEDTLEIVREFPRREREATTTVAEEPKEAPKEKEEELPTKQTKEEKVELEEIDKKLEEILGEN